MTSEVTRALSKISLYVTIPALLFTTAVNCDQDDSNDDCPSLGRSLRKGWPILLLPGVYVGLGLVVGFIAATIGGGDRSFRPIAIAAVAFGNSQVLPITLLTAIGPRELGADPLLYLSAYLVTYPVFQWAVAPRLLGRPQKLVSQQLHETKDEDDATSMTSSHLTEPLVMKPPPQKPSLAKILPPPSVAAVSGMVVALVTPLRGLLVDLKDRDDDAPLEWLFDGVQSIGQAAVPINMFILGNSLAKRVFQEEHRASSSGVPRRARFAVAFAKLAVMPSIGALVGLGLRRFVVDDPAPLFTAMVVTCTPTATNLLVMTELYSAGANTDDLAAAIFLQYLAAPLTLTLWITLFLLLAHGRV